MQILHVEDDEEEAASVKRMLKGVAESCLWTGFGKTAVELARSQSFDLILLDVMLPDIDGYEVVDRLRSANVRTPYLLVSGLVDRDSEFVNLAFSDVDRLVKPYSREELIASIHSAIDRAQRSGSPGVESIDRDKTLAGDDKRRRFRRFVTIKSATIDHGPGLRCRVVNLSHVGAGLRLLDQTERLPHSFMLLFDSGESRVCRLCWRDGDRMGIAFIDR